MVAADFRSRALLFLLGSVVLLKERTRFARAAFRVGVVLQGRRYDVRIGGRTELEVLHEIAIEDEYGDADDIPARTIVDLGAHIGLATLRLLASHPGARVVAVEADPQLVAQLRRNVAGLPVTVVHAAIGAHSGERVFYHSDISSWGNGLEKTLPWQTAVRVPGMSLRELLSLHHLEEVDLLKLDVEGAEWELLTSLRDAPVKVIIGEAHAAASHSPRDFLDALAETRDIDSVRRLDDERAVFTAWSHPLES